MSLRLLNKWIATGLTPAEEGALPPDVLRRATDAVRAKTQEGLEEARGGQLVDGAAFFDRWKARLSSLKKPGRARRRVARSSNRRD